MAISSDSSSFLRQLSSKEGWRKSCTSKKLQMEASGLNYNYHYNNNMLNGVDDDDDDDDDQKNGGGDLIMMMMKKKRVMVVVDQTSHSKHAMMWALTHVTNNPDILTLLHIVSSSSSSTTTSNNYQLATTLVSLCKTSKPQVEVEALVIQGPKMATVMSQVKKLEVSVLVLGHKNPSPLLNLLCLKSSTDEIVEECINSLECLTIGVRKQSKGVGGYLISTRWHKNFWLLA